MPRSLDSLAPIFFELFFILPRGETARIPARRYLQSASVEDQTDSAISGTLELFDENVAELETLLMHTDKTRQIDMRFGWEEDLDRRIDLPLYRLQVTKYAPKFTTAGTTLSLEFVGRSMFMDQTDKSDTLNLGWPENTRITRILKDIASAKGWSWIKKNSDGQVVETIEETDRVIDESLSMQGETALHFITSQVAPRAMNSKTDPMYARLNDAESETGAVDDRPILHFHSDSQLHRNRVVKAFEFAQGEVGEVISFEPEDESIFQAIHGSFGDFDAIDSRVGEKISLRPEGPWRNASRGVFQEERGIPRQAQEGFLGRHPVTSRSLEETISRVQVYAGRHLQGSVTAKLQTSGSHDVAVFDLISVKYTLPSGQPHYMSGVYTVFGVSHEYSASGWITTYDLMRKGFLQSGGENQSVPGAVKHAEEVVGPPQQPAHIRRVSDGP